MRRHLLLPLAAGLLGAAFTGAQARPMQPGAVASGLSPAQVEAIEEATRALTPNVDILVTYDLGRRSYTVEVRDRMPGSGTGDGAPGEGGGGAE